MRIALFLLAILALSLFANAETFLEARSRKSLLTPQRLFDNMKETEFGRSVLNILTLKFKTSGKLDSVLELLNNLEQQIHSQQSSDDETYKANSERNKNILDQQREIVAKATATIAQIQSDLVNANAQLVELNSKQASLTKEQQTIQQQLSELATIRAQETDAYQRRSSNTQLLLDGIEKTLALFRDSAVGNSELDQASVTQIVDLLVDIQNSLKASLADDEQAENQADQDYKDFVNTANSRLANIAELLKQVNLAITQANAQILQLNVNLNAEQSRLKNAEALIAQTTQAQQELDNQYNANKQSRDDQIRLLDQSINLLSNNSQEVQNYLNNA